MNIREELSAKGEQIMLSFKKQNQSRFVELIHQRDEVIIRMAIDNLLQKPVKEIIQELHEIKE